MRVLGVDLGIRKAAVACLTDGELVAARAITTPAEATRDVQLRELASFVHGFAQIHQADSIWVEEIIIGNNRKYSLRLAETKGAVLGSLGHLRFLQDTDTRVVDNKVWKSEVVGNGNASKDAVRDYIHECHSAYAPLCGEDQDLYDACCIGLYGTTVLSRADGLRLQSG